MSWLDAAIRRGVERGARAALDDFCAPKGELSQIVKAHVWETLEREFSHKKKLTKLGFVWALRLCFRRHGSTYDEAITLANSTLREFLTDNGIKFGNPEYAWTRDGAEDVALEYQLRFWEAGR